MLVARKYKPLYISFFMKQTLFLFTTCLLVVSAAFAKGHGGGHGGGGHSHSSVHAGGTHTTSTRSSPGATHSVGHKTSTTNTHIPISRGTSPGAIASNHPHSIPAYHNGLPVPPRNADPTGGAGGGYYPAYPSYYYGYYDPYYYSPFFYNPYFDMWAMGFSMMYSPSYPYMGAAGPSNNYDEGYADNAMEDELEGYAVYAHDTISGRLTLRTNTVYLATKDSSGSYDYTFKARDKELEYVTAFNSEDKQVKLVRLEKNKKRLWRVVHEGKLNLYDDDHLFIYRPEDIDKMSLVAEFNGTTNTLRSFYGVKSKEQLTGYINEAYGLQLDPKKFSWNQLLIYLDKLD